MTDGSPSEDPTLQDPPPPPPPGDPSPRIPLRRSASDRVVAGVAGGVARHFGIDPVIIRLGFVVLAILGGSGVLLYLIAWLVIPREGEYESAAMDALRGGERPGGRSLLALALLIGAILLLSGSLVWWPTFGGGDLFLPLLILAAGIALLVWPTDGYEWYRTWHVDNDQAREERAAIRAEWRAERDAWRSSRREWRHGYRRGFGDETAPPPGTPGGPPPAPPGVPIPPRPPRPAMPRRPRPTPFLGPLAVAVLLLYTGIAVFIERVGWVKADFGLYLAGALVIIGLFLLLSAFIGRARGLIWLGVMILPFAWFFSAVDLVWWSGIGEEQVEADSLVNLEAEYRWGIGEFQVDLGDLDLDGETRRVEVGLTIGELTVWIPHSLGVDIDFEGGIGEIIVQDGDVRLIDEGVNLDLSRRRSGDATAGTLELVVDLGIGQGEVIVCGGPGGTSCP